jgi:predicted Zn-dependent protease
MDEVRQALAAAYAADRAGDAHAAIRLYECARQLGVPEDARRAFTVGYGSTLRDVGRADEAVAVVARAVAEDPEFAPFPAFLALALASAGHPAAALATMLGCALDAARPGAFAPYDRALGAYHRELLDAASGPARGR